MSNRNNDMNCEDVLPLLPPYMEEALPVEIMKQVKKHIDVCGSCRLEMEQTARIIAELKSLRVNASNAPKQAILQSLRNTARSEAAVRNSVSETRSKYSWGFIIRRYGAAAALLLTIGIIGAYLAMRPVADKTISRSSVVTHKEKPIASIPKGQQPDRAIEKKNIVPARPKLKPSELPKTKKRLSIRYAHHVRQKETIKKKSYEKDTIAMKGIQEKTVRLEEKIKDVTTVRVATAYSASDGWDGIDNSIDEINTQMESAEEEWN